LTADDIRHAYVRSDLRGTGVSLQQALAQDSTRIALRVLAAAMRKTKNQNNGNTAADSAVTDLRSCDARL